MGVGPEHATLYPGLSGLLLGKRIGASGDAEGSAGRGAIGPAEMISLTAAAVIQNPLATMLVDDLLETGSYLADGGVPVDGLIGAVFPPPHRRCEPTAIVLVVVEAECLLTGVPLRTDVGLVPAHAFEDAPIELDLYPAVRRAEDTDAFVPGVGRVRGGGCGGSEIGHAMSPGSRSPRSVR